MKKGPSSYEDLVLRHAGERPAARGARRRDAGAKENAAPARDVTTDSHPEDVTARAALLTKRRGELAVPGVSADRLRDLAAQTDENLGYTAPVVAGLAQAFPKVGSAAQASKDGLEAGARQWAEMGKLRGTAAQLRQNVHDTRRKLGGETREEMRELAAWIRAQLAPRAMEEQAQDRLRSETLEFMTAWERVEGEPQAERGKTLAEGAAHAEALSTEESRAEVLRTMLTLQEGGPVDQDEWDRAAARYDELVAEGTPENRRTRAR